jgi:hypothetical protein
MKVFYAMESAMYFHLTNTQIIIGGFALVLTIIFALAAFLDKRWRTAGIATSALSKKPIPSGKAPTRDDTDGSSDMYTRRADLVASGLGTVEQRVTLSSERQHNLAGD